MGLIKGITTAASNVFKDAYKEYFVCELGRNELMAKISKRTQGANKGQDFVITHGSAISVPVGMVMVITDGGRIVDFVADAGEYTYSSNDAPTFFDSGGLFKGIKNLWNEGVKNFQYGGETPKNMAVYAINAKEVLGNKFGTPQPVPFEDPIYRNINIRYNGTYNFKVDNVMTFIQTLAGTQLKTSYKVEDFTDEMKAVFMTYLNQEINQLNTPYTKLTSAGVEITKRMVTVLKGEWYDAYGILLTGVGINAPTLDEKSQERVDKYGDALFFQDNDAARGHIVSASADAMKDAAKNSGGSMVGFMGVNAAQQAAGNMLNNPMFQTQNNQPQNNQQQATGWNCECGGANNQGKFCSDCGKEKPLPPSVWKCACGTDNQGKFCSDCGAEKPLSNDWQCECGTVNASKFCSNCGKGR